MKVRFFVCIKILLLFLITGANGQLPSYFEQLQSEKVYSDAIVSWEQFGPGSCGYCDIIRYHPGNPDCAIMSPDMYNNYRSADNGKSWKTINDYDGTSLGLRRMRGISFSKNNPDFGVMIDERGGFWKTFDMGQNWERGNSPANGVCSVITLDPENDQIIYMAGGNFWNVKWNKRTLASPRRQIPVAPEHFTVKCDFNIPLQHIYKNIGEKKNNCSFHPEYFSNTDYSIVSATEYGRIWRSSDGGENWELINNGLPDDLDVCKILSHPKNSEILYMASNYGLFKSENRGNKWVNIGNKLPHNMIRDLAIYYDEESKKAVLIVIDQVFWEDDQNESIKSAGGVFKSADEGENWESLNNNLYLDLTKLSPFVVKSWYKALSKWLGMSEAETKIKFPHLPQQALQNFNRILLDPTNPGRIYLGHNEVHDISFCAGDLWKTENGGESWIVCNRAGTHWQGTDKEFWQKRGNPINTNMQFGHLQRQVSNSPYGGRLGCRSLTINSHGDVITVMEQQTLQSTDHGNTWKQIDAIESSSGNGSWIGTGGSNLTRPRYYMDELLMGDYLLLSGEHGLWKLSPDDSYSPAVEQIVGQAVSQDDPHSIATVAIHPKNKNIRYLQMYRQKHAGYIRRTIDGGKTWENISQPINFKIQVETGRVRTNSLIMEKNTPEQMYFCVFSWDKITDRKQCPDFDACGVYHSSDAGYTWEIVNKGLPAEANVNQLCFDPKDDRFLYAAVGQSMDSKTKGGLYLTKNRGEEWEALPIPGKIESVNCVHIDKHSGKIYIACGLSEGSPENGGVWTSADKGQSWKRIFHMPYVYQITTAPYNSERIAVTVAENTNINCLNPGAYLSFNDGKTWHKSNKGLGQPYWIVDLKWDLTNPNIIWCGLNGSGWYKGFLNFEQVKTKHGKD